ncbi:hypothetical protein ACOI22_03840 [Glaciecola sp. 2405UD65-10]|uniref:hypothetical protein n=1 Tax=Glaciecola sp. 2405UD65-10 TaxID=3397244 RepID=UPI003B59C8BD
MLSCKPAKPPLKVELCLSMMLANGPNGSNQLEAFSEYGETCLHSTISTLANSHGILIHRQTEKHRNRAGGFAHFTRYTLADPYSVELAHALLQRLKARRNAKGELSGVV